MTAANAAKIVAKHYGITTNDIFQPTRGPSRAAFARQLAMYLTNTILGLSINATARAFNRDRRTVSHALALIEDMRSDQSFDEKLKGIEAQLRQPPPSACRACVQSSGPHGGGSAPALASPERGMLCLVD